MFAKKEEEDEVLVIKTPRKPITDEIEIVAIHSSREELI